MSALSLSRQEAFRKNSMPKTHYLNVNGFPLYEFGAIILGCTELEDTISILPLAQQKNLQTSLLIFF